MSEIAQVVCLNVIQYGHSEVFPGKRTHEVKDCRNEKENKSLEDNPPAGRGGK